MFWVKNGDNRRSMCRIVHLAFSVLGAANMNGSAVVQDSCAIDRKPIVTCTCPIYLIFCPCFLFIFNFSFVVFSIHIRISLSQRVFILYIYMIYIHFVGIYICINSIYIVGDCIDYIYLEGAGELEVFSALEDDLSVALAQDSGELRRSMGRPIRMVRIGANFVPFHSTNLPKGGQWDLIRLPLFHIYWTECNVRKLKLRGAFNAFEVEGRGLQTTARGSNLGRHAN